MYKFKHEQNMTFDDYLRRHVEWGHATFGTPADGRGPLGPLDHLKKELAEIEEDPHDLKEWTDAIILSIDGFLRAGGKVTMVLPMLFSKQTINAMREWPDWRAMDPDKAIEHVRTPAEMDLKSMVDLAEMIQEEPVRLPENFGDKLRYGNKLTEQDKKPGKARPRRKA